MHKDAWCHMWCICIYCKGSWFHCGQGTTVTKRERVRSTNKHPDNFYRPSIKPSLWGSPTVVTSTSALPQILHDSQFECSHRTPHTRCSHHIHYHHSCHSHRTCISFIKIVQRHATPPRTDLSRNRTIHQKLDLSEQKFWVHTHVYNSLDLLLHPVSTTASALDFPRLKTQTHFRSECTRIKRSDWPTPWLTGSSLSTTPPTKLSSPVSLSFWLLLPDANSLAWLATGAAEKLQLTNNADHPHNWLSLNMHLSYSSVPIKLNRLHDCLPESSSNSSIAPFFRLTKLLHPPSFQTDIFHNCSSIPSHNSAPPIGLHAHLVAAVTQASLHSISHTHLAELPMQW